ncbi:MAG: hypothetical protein ABI614_24905 [Planctomycetota bacterium]
MPARDPVSLKAMNADNVGLQVEFAWRQDRHRHTISLLVDDCANTVFESFEGSSVDDWPPSPPLQQLSVEELRPQSQVALLVGMAGKSHWSISVEPAGDRAAFVFDVACRSNGPAERLGSAYLLPADQLAANGDHHAVIEIEGRSIQLRCDREGATAAAVKVDPSGLWIAPTVINAGGTTRWRYTIELL